MFSKSVVVFVVALCSFALPRSSNGQQFRSAHPITVSPAPPTPFFGPVYGIADFNGDGRPDFLVMGTDKSGASAAAVMLQNSNGTFTEKTTSVPAGATIKATVMADLNGDGKTDIVTLLPAPVNDHGDTTGPATLTIAYGNGDGTFRVQAPVNLAGGGFQPAELIEDLNHDGKLDIIVVSGDQYGETTIETYLNNGNGTFRAGPIYPGLTVGDLLAAGDFNGDGFGDLVIKNNFETQILLGKGDGSFTAGATYNVNAYSAAVGDLNRDHYLDLVLNTVKNSVVMLGKGNGTFSTSATLDTTFGTAISSIEFGNPIMPTEVYV